MISPQMWENEGFGELSLLAKLLFIGMISQADDDGKGLLSSKVLKSKIFPYDELRIADIDKALCEICNTLSAPLGGETDKLRPQGHKLSVVFYEVDGTKYYCFVNWHKWQSINRPIPSKLPNAPVQSWVRGGIHSNEEISDNSLNTHGVLTESSRNSIGEVKDICSSYSTDLSYSIVGGDLSDDDYKSLCEKIGKDACDYYIERVKAFREKKPEATFNTKATILKWWREDSNPSQPPEKKTSYTADELDSLFSDSNGDKL